MASQSAEMPDMENRDPNNLNAHLQVQFEEVIGEPEGVRSADCVWKNSYACFNCGKNLCYKLLTLLCGICIALYWGCDFGCTAFNHVWYYTPCLREYAICCGLYQRCFATIINCCVVPLCEGMGYCFSKIQVKNG